MYEYAGFILNVLMFSSLSLAISNGEKLGSRIGTMCVGYSEVDHAISRHREPHVVRVGVERILWMATRHKILLVPTISYLSEDFEVMVRPMHGVSTPEPSMNEHLPGTGGDHTGDVVV